MNLFCLIPSTHFFFCCVENYHNREVLCFCGLSASPLFVITNSKLKHENNKCKLIYTYSEASSQSLDLRLTILFFLTIGWL